MSASNIGLSKHEYSVYLLNFRTLVYSEIISKASSRFRPHFLHTQRDKNDIIALILQTFPLPTHIRLRTFSLIKSDTCNT